MLVVASIEDTPEERKDLKDALLRWESEMGEKIKLYEYADAYEFFDDREKVVSYDVVFMDIEMPLMDGMHAAEKLRTYDEDIPIIFITKTPKYALQGYSVGALDYFLKPIRYYDMKLRLDAIRRRKETGIPKIVIPLPRMKKQLPVNSIYFIETMGHEVTWHTEEGDFSISRGASLKSMESTLPKASFARCNSSYLVNLYWCTELKGDVVKVKDAYIKISRGLKKEFVTKLSEYMMSN